MKTIAVINQKGGVGKTSTAYNLAHFLGRTQRTLLVDLDPSSNSSRALITNMDQVENTVRELFLDKNLDPVHCTYKSSHGGNLEVIPSKIGLAMVEQMILKRLRKEGILANQLSKIDHKYEYSIIDCSPTLSDLTVNAMYAADFILIPIDYEEDAIVGMTDLFVVLKEVKEDQEFDFKILRNGFDKRKNTINSYIQERIKNFTESGKVFNTVIRQCEDINLAKLGRQPVDIYNSQSRGAEDYRQLTEEIING